FTVATRRPSTQVRDCIDVVRCSGARDRGGVVRAEVDEVIRLLRSMRFRERSIGVVTPFRAQADAIQEAILAAFEVSDVAAMALRVGTVHAFQGNERDVVIASMGVGEHGNWAFVEDPALLAVLLTRARLRMVVVTACEPPAGGLVAQYVAQEDTTFSGAPPAP